MNCVRFEKLVSDLARDGVPEDSSREECLAHAAMCPMCSSLLADHEALAAWLRQLSLSLESQEAPEKIEVELRKRFRDRVVSGPVHSDSRWAFAVGLAAVLFLGVAIGRMFSVSSREPNDGMSSVSEDRKPVSKVAATDSGSLENGIGRAAAPAPASRTLRRRPAPVLQGKESAAEITTGFLTVHGGGDLAALEGGRLIRVRMPRSALLTFGLPMNAERAQQPVNADVLVGPDGIARAIRFVH